MQLQGYDHVLKEDELEQNALEQIFEYIARNPERKGLVPIDNFAKYPFTNCLIPGYPEIVPFVPDFLGEAEPSPHSLKADEHVS